MWGAELLRKGLRWDVRNGRRAMFWKDVCLEQVALTERLQSQPE